MSEQVPMRQVWQADKLSTSLSFLLQGVELGGYGNGVDHPGYLLMAASPRKLARGQYFNLGQLLSGVTGARGVWAFASAAKDRDFGPYFVNRWNEERVGLPMSMELYGHMAAIAREHVATRQKRMRLPPEFTVRQPFLRAASYRVLPELVVRAICGGSDAYVAEAAFMTPLEGFARTDDPYGRRQPVEYAKVRDLIYWIREQTGVGSLITPDHLLPAGKRAGTALVRRPMIRRP